MNYLDIKEPRAMLTKRAFPWALVGKLGVGSAIGTGLGWVGHKLFKSIDSGLKSHYNKDVLDRNDNMEDNPMYKRFRDAEKRGMNLSAPSAALRKRIENDFNSEDKRKKEKLAKGEIDEVDYKKWRRDAVNNLYKDYEDSFEYKADKNRYMAANPQFMQGMGVMGYNPAMQGGYGGYGYGGRRRRRRGGYGGYGGDQMAYAQGFMAGNSYGFPGVGGMGGQIAPGMTYAPTTAFQAGGTGFGQGYGYTPMY